MIVGLAMVQLLIVHSAFAKDPRSVSNTHMITTTCNSSSTGIDVIFWILDIPHYLKNKDSSALWIKEESI